jgi:outer membrane protein assembly factor BamB
MSAPLPDPDCPAIGVSSQAFVTENIVYVGGGDAALYALDKTSGAVAVRVHLANTNDGTYLWSSIV